MCGLSWNQLLFVPISKENQDSTEVGLELSAFWFHGMTSLSGVHDQGPPGQEQGWWHPRVVQDMWTDFTLRAMKVAVQALGFTISSLVVQEYRLWLIRQYCAQYTLKASRSTLKMADPSPSSGPAQEVKYEPNSESVRLPKGLVSVAGVTVVTGGAELSCSSCMLAFGFWGTLVGLSVVFVGLWDISLHRSTGVSHLLGLGLVLLLTSASLVILIFCLRFLLKHRRLKARRERAEANLVLVNEYAGVVLKRVTV
ncbi:hypothetical protein DNTS_017889 [Danionella cerebrum]|uniref:Transmembrane protein 100 n=1 Tax=Danionella cerebrum TaxID=2873325 RepID=A0A553N245_9TELE|nr:hypothetical protein DNTS_017889 [Danionella translucida]